ncbi:MAG: phy [Nocardioides sp.]|nr:phy [Nocardioides sp.]
MTASAPGPYAAARPPRRSLRRAAAGAAALGLLVLTAGWLTADRVDAEVTELASRTLDTRAAAIEESAAAEVQRYVDALDLVAAALAAAPQVDAASFDVATEPLGAMELAGATSFVFIAAPVSGDELDAFAATWRDRGSPDLVLSPAEGQDTHAFAVLTKPLDGSLQRRTGVDVAGATAPYEALMESQRSGEPAVSDAYQLLIDQELPESERQTSFSVTAPVVRDGELAGWVLMGLRGQDFLGQVLESAAEGLVDVEMTADDTAGAATVVASTSGLPDDSTDDDLRRSETILVAQHVWTLTTSTDVTALVGLMHHRPLAIRFVTVVIAVLVAGLWWTATSSRARAQAQVQAATRELALAEATARGQATLLDTMVETIDAVGVSVVDASGAYLVQSRAARSILGVDAPGVLGLTGIGDVDDPSRWQEHYGMYRVDGTTFPEAEMPLLRALAGEGTDDVEMVIRNRVRADGVRIAVSARPLDLGDGRPGALAVFRDVTEERRQQEELAGFAGMVAHDLKSPLTVVRGYLDIFTDEVMPQLSADVHDPAWRYLSKASDASARMAALIDDLLAYTSARDGALHLEEVDLRDMVGDVLGEVVAGHLAMRDPADHDAPSPMIHVGDLPVVHCDAERMRQVVANLVGNALKYVAPGGRPVIEVTAEPRADGSGVRLYVADRGIGVPPHLQGDILKPFVRGPATTADPVRYPGTGLGLAICTRIVERHGGSFSLRANPGGGTIAAIDLPDQRLLPAEDGAVGATGVPELVPVVPSPRSGDTAVAVTDEPAVTPRDPAVARA